MSVNLVKGQKINLSKEIPTLRAVTVGLGWDIATRGRSIDCDSSVFVLREKQQKKSLFGNLFKSQSQNDNAKILDSDDIVYYGNLRHPNHCIRHRGDNLVGGSGKRNDDEQIEISLKEMPEDVKRLVVVINIYDCYNRNQNFGMIKNCYARIVDDDTQKEICRYNLSDDYTNYTALVVGEFYRDENGEWQFSAIGAGTDDGSVSALAKRYR